jgi:hypothetical protein
MGVGMLTAAKGIAFEERKRGRESGGEEFVHPLYS